MAEAERLRGVLERQEMSQADVQRINLERSQVCVIPFSVLSIDYNTNAFP